MIRSHPLILAFDTSGASCDAAVLRGTEVLAQASEQMAKGQAERLLGLCHDLMVQADRSLADLDAIGVGVGPGNFTGIRISVSAARGLALGLNIPAVGVSAFEALRHGADGACCCAVDARRGQVYVQEFDASGAASDPFLTDVKTLAARSSLLIGHGGTDPTFVRAEAIARIAGAQFGQNPPRPAPLYLRPADAAPARDTPPRILA